MDLRLTIALGFAILSVTVGLALRMVGADGLGSTMFLAVGSSVGASVLALLVARLLGFARPGTADQDAEQRLATLIDQLTAAATEAERRGLLALAQSQVPAGGELFKQGVQMVLSASEPAVIHARLLATEDRLADRQRSEIARRTLTGRIAYVTILAGSVAVMIWQTLSERSGSAADGAIGVGGSALVLAGVYGAFILAVLVENWSGRRLVGSSKAREDALKASLVVEALLGIQANEPPGALRQRLEGLCGLAGQVIHPARPHTRDAA